MKTKLLNPSDFDKYVNEVVIASYYPKRMWMITDPLHDTIKYRVEILGTTDCPVYYCYSLEEAVKIYNEQ